MNLTEAQQIDPATLQPEFEGPGAKPVIQALSTDGDSYGRLVAIYSRGDRSILGVISWADLALILGRANNVSLIPGSALESDGELAQNVSAANTARRNELNKQRNMLVTKIAEIDAMISNE